jgi:hypothetical protein
MASAMALSEIQQLENETKHGQGPKRQFVRASADGRVRRGDACPVKKPNIYLRNHERKAAESKSDVQMSEKELHLADLKKVIAPSLCIFEQHCLD